MLSPSESPFVEHSTHPKILCSFFTFGYHLILYTVCFAFSMKLILALILCSCLNFLNPA
jgi:hypothetical protein